MINKIKGMFTSLFSKIFKGRKHIKLGIYGPPNAGKSTLANKVCLDWLGQEMSSVSAVPHETREIIIKEKINIKSKGKELTFNLVDTPGIATKIDYEDVKIQLIEIPAIFDGFYNSDKGPSLFAIMRECDLIVVILDGLHEPVSQLKTIENELRRGGIYLDGVQKPGVYAKKGLVCVNKKFSYVNTIHKICSFEDLKQNIWDKLDVIYVQTKMPGKKADWPPVALKKGNTVRELAEKVHKDFLEKFKYAKIWGPSVKHNATSVGLEHELKSKDIVEFHLK